MNLLAGTLIFIACTYIGIGIDNFYKTKVKILGEFIEFIDFTLTEINYLKTDMLAIIKKYNHTRSTKLSNALKSLNNPLNARCENFSISYLTYEDKQQIISFIKDIARLDADGQKVYVEEYKQRVNSYIKYINAEQSVKGKLAKSLRLF